MARHADTLGWGRGVGGRHLSWLGEHDEVSEVSSPLHKQVPGHASPQAGEGSQYQLGPLG